MKNLKELTIKKMKNINIFLIIFTFSILFLFIYFFNEGSELGKLLANRF